MAIFIKVHIGIVFTESHYIDILIGSHDVVVAVAPAVAVAGAIRGGAALAVEMKISEWHEDRSSN